MASGRAELLKEGGIVEGRWLGQGWRVHHKELKEVDGKGQWVKRGERRKVVENVINVIGK